MLQDLLKSRAIHIGCVFFLLVVGGAQFYSWHFRHTTETELARTRPATQILENRNEERTAPATYAAAFKTPEPRPRGTSFGTNNPQETFVADTSETIDAGKPDAIYLPQDESETSVIDDFPEVPEGFPMIPVWTEFPNYQKGDMPEHETLYRVLIKLWNQGDRAFINGVLDHNNGRIYPLYPNVIYVKWRETTVGPPDNPITVRVPGSMLGTHARHFSWEDRIFGLEAAYPEIKFVEKQTAGYDPETFLTDAEK